MALFLLFLFSVLHFAILIFIIWYFYRLLLHLRNIECELVDLSTYLRKK